MTTPEEFGAKGGKARAAKLSPEDRSRIAQDAAAARWNIPTAVYEGTLRIGGAEIPCAVLDNGERVLSRIEFIRAIGRKGKAKGGRKYDQGFKLPVFLTAANLKPFISNELPPESKPVRYRRPRGGDAIGYRADFLPYVCNVFIRADNEKALRANQAQIADACRILRAGFEHVGLIALIDEATGFQRDRPAMQLAEILDAFIAKELRPWVRKFPFEFYQEIFRLKGWDASDLKPGSPMKGEVGRITLDLIYSRLAPGIRPTLKRLTPRNEKGYLKHKMHQWLTSDIGDPKLETLIGKVITTMKLSDDWTSLLRNLERAGIRRYDENFDLQFPSAPRALAALSASSSPGASPSSE